MIYSYWNRKKWNKKQGGFLGALLPSLAASLVQPVISSVVKGISGRGVRRAGRRYVNRMISTSFFKQYWDY